MSSIPLEKPRARYPTAIRLVRIRLRRLRDPLLTVLLVVQIFILFVLPGLHEAGFELPHIAVDGVLVGFSLLACATSRSRGGVVAMVFSVSLTVVGAVWHHERPDFLTDSAAIAGEVLAQLTLLWIVAGAVFGPGPITYHRILGAVVMYLSIGLLFSSLDMLLARSIPGAFSNLPPDRSDLRNALRYFSFCAMTSSGWGDILPVHPIARSLANVETICGQLFPATLLARVVGLHVSRRP